MKTFILTIIIALLLGGIIGTSFDMFGPAKQGSMAAMLKRVNNAYGDKLSIRQIDSLSAGSNLSFTIKNEIQ